MLQLIASQLVFLLQLLCDAALGIIAVVRKHRLKHCCLLVGLLHPCVYGLLGPSFCLLMHDAQATTTIQSRLPVSTPPPSQAAVMTPRSWCTTHPVLLLCSAVLGLAGASSCLEGAGSMGGCAWYGYGGGPCG